MDPNTRNRHTLAKACLALLLAATGSVAALVPSTPASADVHGCTAAGWPTCVMAQTGGKNFSNRTQWIGRVQGFQYQGGGPGGRPVYGRYEVWGDGFYYATTGYGIERYPNRWLRSGTNVCTRGPLGAVACIAIRV